MGRARRNVQRVVRHDQPFASVLGRGRGLGLPPRMERLTLGDLDGYAQFGHAWLSVVDERRQEAAEGELPMPYRVVTTLDLDAATWASLNKDVRTYVRAYPFDATGINTKNTTASIEVLREADDPSEYNTSEWNVFNAGRYYTCLRLRSPEGETLLLTQQYFAQDHFSLLVGWPCPDEDARPWVTLDPSFIGCCADDYDVYSAEEILRELSDALGLHVVCVWDNLASGFDSGDSEWMVVAGEDGNQLVDLPGRVWEILSDPTVTDTRVNTASVGTVPSLNLNDLARHSDHNYVRNWDALDAASV